MTIRILRRPEVQARTGLSRSTIYAMMAVRTFPTPIKLGVRAVGWPEFEISEWLESRQGRAERGLRWSEETRRPGSCGGRFPA